MIVRRLLFLMSILIFPHLLFSEVPVTGDQIEVNNSKQFSDVSLRLPPTSIKSGFALNKKRTYAEIYPDIFNVKSFEEITIQNQVVQPKWIRASIVPATLITAGAITLMVEPYCLLSKYTIQEKVNELFPDFHSTLDNYLQYAPLAAVFALKAAGVRSRSDFLNQVIITAKAELLMTVIVQGMKKYIPSERPSGSGMNSMPSGHTAQAFVSATILDMEYRNISPWISVGGYAMATTTAVYRMANNQHWISDVLIGAGIGLFSTKVVYFTHRYRWGKKDNMVVFPAFYKNGAGISFGMLL
jgi:membrane-associated phospholipid phosphatase